jgi:peroxiredoxin family protein
MDTPPLFIMLCSGEHEKIQMAAMTASVAAVSERPVQLFVSMNAVSVFKKDLAGDRYAGGEFSQIMKDRGAPDAIELLRQGKTLGDLKAFVCSMSLDVAEIGLDAMVDDLFDDVGGLTSFLSDAESGQLVVI